MQIAAEKAQKLGSVAAIYVQTPANPTNGIVDIAAARVLAGYSATDGRSSCNFVVYCWRQIACRYPTSRRHEQCVRIPSRRCIGTARHR